MIAPRLALRLLICLVVATSCCDSVASAGELRFLDIQQVSREAIEKRYVPYELPSVERRATGYLLNVPRVDHFRDDPLDIILCTQISLELYRLAYNKSLNRKFWQPHVDECERIVRETMLPILNRAGDNVSEKRFLLHKCSDEIHKKLVDIFCEAVESQGLTPGYTVHHAAPEFIMLGGPEVSAIYSMHILEWNCIKKGWRDPIPLMNRLTGGSIGSFGGHYVLRVEFNDGTALRPAMIRLSSEAPTVISKNGIEGARGIDTFSAARAKSEHRRRSSPRRSTRWCQIVVARLRVR